ncbi:hypothetical protein C8R47DRAFT_1080452 [Mycena vitilis]|nr:hypothetical protein C8R47DRAFT_1080452 [Mycena vitilis]
MGWAENGYQRAIRGDDGPLPGMVLMNLSDGKRHSELFRMARPRVEQGSFTKPSTASSIIGGLSRIWECAFRVGEKVKADEHAYASHALCRRGQMQARVGYTPDRGEAFSQVGPKKSCSANSQSHGPPPSRTGPPTWPRDIALTGPWLRRFETKCSSTLLEEEFLRLCACLAPRIERGLSPENLPYHRILTDGCIPNTDRLLLKGCAEIVHRPIQGRRNSHEGKRRVGGQLHSFGEGAQQPRQSRCRCHPAAVRLVVNSMGSKEQNRAHATEPSAGKLQPENTVVQRLGKRERLADSESNESFEGPCGTKPWFFFFAARFFPRSLEKYLERCPAFVIFYSTVALGPVRRLAQRQAQSFYNTLIDARQALAFRSGKCHKHYDPAQGWIDH